MRIQVKLERACPASGVLDAVPVAPAGRSCTIACGEGKIKLRTVVHIFLIM
jgi:hypothetical protein